MNKNEIFTLWIPLDNKKELPTLAHLSLKSMVLCGHDVILYTYSHLENVPEGVEVLDGNEILDSSRIFRSTTGFKSYSGFADIFRLHRLYKYGGTWLDLDVLLIRNINEKFNDNILLCSEPSKKFYFLINNGAMRFPKNDPFIKYMLDYAEKIGSNTYHGQIGPQLVSNTLKKFPEYNNYIKHFNIYCMLEYRCIGDYTKTPEKLLNKINMDEVMGFHINNAVFERYITNNNPNGLYEILKKIILNSNSYEEYYANLKEYHILDSNKYDIIKEWDLKYLDINDDNFNNSFEYTILINSKNLKKVEIYNLIHSIGFGCEEEIVDDIQIIIFGKTNMGEDKVKFKDNIMLLASDFENIYPYISEYIYGDYIIPINQPIIFCPKFFKDKIMKTDNKNYIIEEGINILNKKDFWYLLYLYGCENIFNLTKKMLTDFNTAMIDEKSHINYGARSDKVLKLIQIIDGLNKNYSTDITSLFLKSKFELKELEFNNLIDEVSYHYYSSYTNIIQSSSFHEFKLKELNTRLNCLNGFYLNKFNNKYLL